MSKPSQSAKVQEYYDRNTRRFLIHGEGGKEMAIRRAVWAPGIQTREQAMQLVNDRILVEIAELGAQRVLDLGCGVGGSILYLASRCSARFLGVTLSPVQVRIGREILRERGIENGVLQVGDFSSPPFWDSLDRPIDLAFSIEATVHVHDEDIRNVLAGAAKSVRKGGRLIIMDDFLAEEGPRNPREKRRLHEFKEGWHAGGLRRVSELVRFAAEAGFDLLKNEDFTSYLEIDRTRNRIVRGVVNLLRWTPLRGAWFSNLYGGNALQLALKNGLIEYRYLVFERRSS